MHINWLGREQVRGYGRDLLFRLLAAYPEPPDLWYAITTSGKQFAVYLWQVLAEMANADDSPADLKQRCKEYRKKLEVKTVVYQNEKVFHAQTPDLSDDVSGTAALDDFSSLRGRRVLLLDSTIHSGTTFKQVFNRLAREQPALLISYSLSVKRSSAFFPTYWGCTVEDSDRIYFLLDRLPNNRLDSGRDFDPADDTRSHKPQEQARELKWCITRLAAEDCDLPPVKCGVASMDNITWHDRFFDMESSDHGLVTYLCREAETNLGYLTFHLGRGNTLTIDEIAVSTTHQKRGIGGVLLRFAEAFARQINARTIRLYGIKERLDFYTNFRYRPVQDTKEVPCGRDETYQLMEKRGIFRTYYEIAA